MIDPKIGARLSDWGVSKWLNFEATFPGTLVPHFFMHGAILKRRLHNFWDFGDLFCILARSLVLNPRNLPYYVCIRVTPIPPLGVGVI